MLSVSSDTDTIHIYKFETLGDSIHSSQAAITTLSPPSIPPSTIGTARGYLDTM
jgi:hypothetical protein